jgi:hypothetical protein
VWRWRPARSNRKRVDQSNSYDAFLSAWSLVCSSRPETRPMNATSNATLMSPPTANTVLVPTSSVVTPATPAATSRTPQLISRLAR